MFFFGNFLAELTAIPDTCGMLAVSALRRQVKQAEELLEEKRCAKGKDLRTSKNDTNQRDD